MATLGTMGPLELPVHLLVGNPDSAQPTPLGSVHTTLRLDGDDLPEAGVRLIPVDEHDLRAQLADLLDAQAAALRLPVLDGEVVPDDEEVPGAAPRT